MKLHEITSEQAQTYIKLASGIAILVLVVLGFVMQSITLKEAIGAVLTLLGAVRSIEGLLMHQNEKNGNA